MVCSIRSIRMAAALALPGLIAGCDRRLDVGPVVVSAIGGSAKLADADRVRLSEPDRMLVGGVAQGLVRFDAAGQIEQGAAERWIVIDDGMSYIFRLREGQWPDGRAVTARDVAIILKRAIAPASRNPIAPYLTAIDDIVEMTPQVIEVRLKRPRPDLLKLFAQPELAVLRLRPPGGSGPFRVAGGSPTAPLLAPVVDPARATDEVEPPRSEDSVRMIVESAARAIVRFAARRSDLVSGGTMVDWPLLVRSDVAPASIRIDPAAGLFGLAVVNRDGFLGDVFNRDAIAQAFDRATLTGSVAAEWQPVDQILPERLDSAALPAIPAWRNTPLAVRRSAASLRVATWAKAHPEGVGLRLALPAGPGATLLWGRLAANLIEVGILPIRVGWNDPADLRLIDAVAPYDSARWYLATACNRCGGATQAALEVARIAPTLADRARAIAAADVALNEDVAFIPLARPLRWSLVAPRLRAWQPNSRAWHPLNHLRPDTN